MNPFTGAIVDGNTVAGGTQPDSPLQYGSGDENEGTNPFVVGSAYANNDNNVSTSTTLYGIDYNLDALVRQDPPNAGTLSTIGSLGVNSSRYVGFDIFSNNNGMLNQAYASLSGADSRLYTIDLVTGDATLVGTIGDGSLVRGIAVAVPVQLAYGVSQNNRLVTFNTGAPGILLSSRPIVGLATGETVLGIDFRPASGRASRLGEQRQYLHGKPRPPARRPW